MLKLSMKKNLTLFILFICSNLDAQTFVKANVFSTLLTIPNVGIETSIGKKSTFQFSKMELFKY